MSDFKLPSMPSEPSAPKYNLNDTSTMDSGKSTELELYNKIKQNFFQSKKNNSELIALRDQMKDMNILDVNICSRLFIEHDAFSFEENLKYIANKIYMIYEQKYPKIFEDLSNRNFFIQIITMLVYKSDEFLKNELTVKKVTHSYANIGDKRKLNVGSKFNEIKNKKLKLNTNSTSTTANEKGKLMIDITNHLLGSVDLFKRSKMLLTIGKVLNYIIPSSMFMLYANVNVANINVYSGNTKNVQIGLQITLDIPLFSSVRFENVQKFQYYKCEEPIAFTEILKNSGAKTFADYITMGIKKDLFYTNVTKSQGDKIDPESDLSYNFISIGNFNMWLVRDALNGRCYSPKLFQVLKSDWEVDDKTLVRVKEILKRKESDRYDELLEWSKTTGSEIIDDDGFDIADNDPENEIVE